MANTLKLEIVTPEALTYSENVDMVTLPGVEGEMGVFPNHVPLMTEIKAGEVILQKDGKTQFLAVGDGFVKITGNHVAVMTDMAIDADDIDLATAEEARKRAEVRLREKLSDEEIATVNAALANALAQIKVKRGHKK